MLSEVVVLVSSCVESTVHAFNFDDDDADFTVNTSQTTPINLHYPSLHENPTLHTLHELFNKDYNTIILFVLIQKG